jgi:gamma-glutamyl:cysteine ligase YbdK (ATP-grasp superfamily)
MSTPDAPSAAASYRYPIGLGGAVGVELEYMIVDEASLDVRPIADELIRAVAGAYDGDAEPDGPTGVIGWSNELALHVIELKTIRPVPAIDPLAPLFQDHVRRIEEILAPMGARLMPTAMHPWMDPEREMRLWPHDENTAVYEAFDRIFSCRGHGWANLQSAHLNLPFGDDEEFGRLHSAIRVVLPLLPALAASSPIVDGAPSGFADTRLEVYRTNSRRIPSVAGGVIPEPVFTRRAYETEILGSMYRDIAPHDPDGVLCYEWLNARGCIARFERGSIEVRLLDVQECPAADLAIVALVAATIDALARGRLGSAEAQRSLSVEAGRRVLAAATRDGEAAEVDDWSYLRLLDFPGRRGKAGDVWRHLARTLLPPASRHQAALSVILDRGTLARRILAATGPAPSRADLARVYRALCGCLRAGRMFDGAS